MCRIYENTLHQTSIQGSGTINILSYYRNSYSSSAPSLVFWACQHVRLCLLDLHGHDHLADIAASRSTCRCRRLHREHPIGRQKGADAMQVNVLGQPERKERDERSRHILQLQLSIFIKRFHNTAHFHVFVADLLVFPCETSWNHSVCILSFLMIP